MQIHGLQSASAAQLAQRANTAKPAGPVQSAPAASSVPPDQLDLSAEAQQIGQSQSASESSSAMRMDKVAALRQAIASGSYETPEKMSQALDRMLDTFA